MGPQAAGTGLAQPFLPHPSQAKEIKTTFLKPKNYIKNDKLNSSFSQLIIRDAVAKISSYDALVEIWKDDHEKWCVEKKNWEEKPENKQYLNLPNLW